MSHDSKDPKKYSLVIHGGAGAVFDVTAYKPSIEKILRHGIKLLDGEASAIDVVEACVTLFEDDPIFNAGKGSVLNEEGKIDLDAAIMDGSRFMAGAVAGVQNIKNPIQLARLVMEKTEHVMLIDRGAMAFAKTQNVAMEPDAYFFTEKRTKQWEEAKKQSRVVLDHSAPHEDLKGGGSSEKKYGTVGAVVCDVHGNLAAGTSTGGIVNKKYGRVGDTPIVGAGVYADNETCAVSATGYGEQFMRTVLAKTISDVILYEKVDAQKAADLGIAYLVRKVKGLGGVIVLDNVGRVGISFSTQGMIYGVAKSDGTFRVCE